MSIVTRFGKIVPFWQFAKSFENTVRVYLVFGKILNQFCHPFIAIGKKFTVVNGKILKKLSSHLVTLQRSHVPRCRLI